MSNQSLLTKTFTIYELKPNFQSHTNLRRKKHQQQPNNQEVQAMLEPKHQHQKESNINERQTTPLLSSHRITVNMSKASDQLMNKQMSLPSLLSKYKASTTIIEPFENGSANSNNKANGNGNEQNGGTFYVTKKSTFNTYHKIEKLINQKYNVRIQKIISQNGQAKKPLSFLNLQNQQPHLLKKIATHPKISIKLPKDYNLRKSMQLHLNNNQKNHLNRVKSIFFIPLQLQTQRCEQNVQNMNNLKLQLKNKMRFKFDRIKDYQSSKEKWGSMNVNLKLASIAKEEWNDIKGWNFEGNKELSRYINYN